VLPRVSGQPSKHRSHLLLVAFGVALSLPQYSSRATPQPQRNRLVSELVATVGNRRLFEARLSGGFGFGPIELPRSRRRGPGSSTPSIDVHVLAAAAALLANTTEPDGPAAASAHATALVYLGRETEAIETLDEQVSLQTFDAQTLNDLAAALLVRNERTARSDDLPRALDAVRRSLRLAPTCKEAKHNEIVALARLGLRPQAAQAQLEYERSFAEETTWTNFTASLLSRDPPALAGTIPNENDAGNRGRENPLTGTSPSRLHLMFERALTGDLQQAATAARLYRRATGDSALEATLGALSQAPPATQRAFSIYSRAVDAYATGQLVTAEELFRSIPPGRLDRRSSAWSSYYFGVLAYWRGDMAGAHRRLERSAALCRGVDSYLCARTHWMFGLLDAVGARMGLASRHYERALASMERLADEEQVLALHSLIAETDDYLGQSDSAWMRRIRVLAALPTLKDASRRQTVLLTATEALLQLQMRDAAAAFAEAAVADAPATEPALVAQAALYRARTMSRSDPGLRDALGHADHAIQQIPDAHVRDRIAGEWLLAAAEAQPDNDDVLSRAHAYFSRRQHDTRLAPITAQQAVRVSELGDTMAALRLGEEALSRLSNTAEAAPITRTSVLSRVLNPLGLVGARALQAASSPATLSEALRIADIPRHYGLFAERLPLINPRALQRFLDTDELVVAYFMLSNELVRVTIDREAILISPITVDEATLRRLAVKAVNAARRGERDSADLAALSRLLLDPATMLRGSVRKWIFVPDRGMSPIPFAALSVGQGQLLLDRGTVAICPSLSVLARPIWTHQGLWQAAVVVPSSPSSPMGLEAGEVQRVWGPRLRRVAATKSGLRSTLASNRVLHFVGHALADGRPGFERILLDGDESLTSADLWALRTNSPLVVLAACSTARGSRGVEAVQTSIALGLLAAGAEATLATLWDIQDDSAIAGAMKLFHSEICVGRPPLEALKSMQDELRRQQHPDWPAFVMILGGHVARPQTH
jgi:CHAT domain-containing protein